MPLVNSFGSRFRVGRVAVILAVLGVAAPARARTYTLPELIELARKNNPALAVAAQQTAAIEAQLVEARRSWHPTGELVSLIAPSPEIRCQIDPGLMLARPPGQTDKQYRQDHCFETNVSEARLNLKGVFTRTELRMVQPVFTFGKISAGVNAAEAGIASSRNREAAVAAELDLNVRKAYWGVKTAREILETLAEGIGHVEEGQKTIDKALADQSGTVTIGDKLRMKTLRVEVEARRLEFTKLEDIARSGLRFLIGAEARHDLEVDAEPIEPIAAPARPVSQSLDQARLSRPEARALDFLVASRQALADFERRKQYPDLVLMGTATFAFASSIDDPKNAFANDPFNSRSVGLAAALRMPLDLGVKNARALRVHAEAQEAYHRRREALGGITFEIEKAHAGLTEAQARVKVMKDGEKAGKQWINLVAQNFAAGLAETKDFADALLAYFQFRIRYLEAVYDANLAVATLSRAVGAEIAP